MSKWEELEKAARAATPGPWAAKRWNDDDADTYGWNITVNGYLLPLCEMETDKPEECDANAAYIAAANPSAILELLAERDALKAENERLTNCLKKANDQTEDFERRWYLADMELDRIRAMEPVAWRIFDGEGGYDYRTYDMNEDYAEDYAKRNPKYAHWVEPLYTLEKP